MCILTFCYVGTYVHLYRQNCTSTSPWPYFQSGPHTCFYPPIFTHAFLHICVRGLDLFFAPLRTCRACIMVYMCPGNFLDIQPASLHVQMCLMPVALAHHHLIICVYICKYGADILRTPARCLHFSCSRAFGLQYVVHLVPLDGPILQLLFAVPLMYFALVCGWPHYLFLSAAAHRQFCMQYIPLRYLFWHLHHAHPVFSYCIRCRMHGDSTYF